MKQILQNLKNGAIELAEVPCPGVKPHHLLIRSSHTLVSAGTERMLLAFGRANLIDKALQQPDKVRKVLDKIKTDGLMPTLETVLNKLDQPLPLGYCNIGIVMEVGPGVIGFAVGDRVVSNGKHAEVVCVPMNLCAKVPEQVADEDAAFTVLGAIALQGIRLIQPLLGEAVVVLGLGLIGLMTVQLLRAQGCRVLGIDPDIEKSALARRFGAEVIDGLVGEDVLAVASAFSRGRGVDAVIITASTKSSEPVHQAAQMCRKRGRIVLVGVAGLELSRADFFEKELTFQVSCSYGPGRYDPNYEEKGQDYPIGFVRWTEQRNFEAVLDMMADRRLDVQSLVSHRFDMDSAEMAYELLAGAAPSLGILLRYPGPAAKQNESLRKASVRLGSAQADQVAFAFVGAGNYALAKLMPAFKQAGARLKTVASSSGVSGVHAGRKFGFEETTTDADLIFNDAAVSGVVIATRHDSHARLACQALKAGKPVFVEKPLCLTLDELDEIKEVYRASIAPCLMVGFNRRFSPHVLKIKSLLQGVRDAKSFVMTVNAGAIPIEHWTQDPLVGGGRVIGEVCHFIDLLRYLAGVEIVDHKAMTMGATKDTVTIQLAFADGSLGSVHYFANGHSAFPKERLEIFAGGRILQLDNFRKLRGFGWPKFNQMNLWRQDKGQNGCAESFVKCVKQGETAPIPFDELFEVSRMTIEIAHSLGGGPA